MKLAAVVPALFVLISLCGSPVPAPPGSVSGVAYYDANRNGIHDSCDRPLALATVVATGADGKAATSTSGPDGTFHIDKVDPGPAFVTLAAPDGEVWHTTTTTADGVPGAAVEVKDLRDTGGVEIGATSPSPMSATQISVSGVIFDDANGNGQIDKDECGISMANAFVKLAGELDRFSPQPSAPNADGTYAALDLEAPGVVHPNPPEPGWVATTGRPGHDPCSEGVAPSSWNGTTVYEANIGFMRGNITSSFTGTVFDDQNSNGVRDTSEIGVPGVELLLEPNGVNCGASPSNTTTDSAGKFEFKGVQSGSYQMVMVQKLQPSGNQTITLNYPQHVYVMGRTDLTADVPAFIEPAGYINALFFNDDNNNGQWDAGERPAPYVNACASTTQKSACATSDATGRAVLGPVPTGVYSILLTVPNGHGQSQALSHVHLDAPGSVAVDVPVAPELTPTPEQGPAPVAVIPSGAAAQTMSVCYSDPGWVQRPFEDGYDPAQPFYASWGVNEAAARAIYDVGVYASTPTNAPDVYIWSAIAGLPWREPPGCDPSQMNGPTPTYDLVGLEPISAADNQGATQITVRPTGHGLYGIMLSTGMIPLNKVPAKNVLFIDESNTPIAQCNFQGACQRD